MTEEEKANIMAALERLEALVDTAQRQLDKLSEANKKWAEAATKQRRW